MEQDEACDDGNDVGGDGCTQCRRPGDLQWHSSESCDGRLSPGNDETLLVSCFRDAEHLFVRYGLDGSRTEGPPPPRDPNELYNPPYLLAEQPSGDLYVVTEPTRNATTANGSRVRVHRLQSDGSVTWSRDLTTFPNGPRESAGDLAVGGGREAVVGITIAPNAAQLESNPYVALLTETGELSWKKVLTDLPYGRASAVALAEEGTVFVAGTWDLDGDTLLPSQAWIAAFDLEGTELWARTTPLGYFGVVPDIRLSEGELQVLLEAVAQDELVPDPPRLTATVEVIALDAGSGELKERRVLATKQTDGEEWRDIAYVLPRGGFSDSPSLDSYSYSTNSLAGYGADGTELFSSSSTPTRSVGFVQGSLALGDLLCLNVADEDAAGLSCYLAR